MKIIVITRSPEPCAEAGWHASQYHLDHVVDRRLAEALGTLGTLTMLDRLRQPFFKVEHHHYMVKGLLGDTSIRVACHRDHAEEVEKIRQLINDYE